MKKIKISTIDIIIFTIIEMIIILMGYCLYEEIITPKKEHLREWEEKLENYTEEEKECFIFYKENGYILTYCEKFKERFEKND